MAAELQRPVFIISMPRSGSTLLYNLLSGSPDAFTIRRESHLLIEGIAGLHPSERQWSSNRLAAEDATPEVVAELTARFLAQMVDRDGRRPDPAETPVLLEKTPKNILRVPFLAAAYPDARFIYLHREPVETMSSMLEGWRLPPPRFKTYPDLPGWGELNWSFLLVPGWRELIGQPLAHVVVEQWTRATTTVLADLAEMEAKRWCLTDFRQLLATPNEEIGRLCEFLGWSFDRPLPDPLPLSGSQVSAPAEGKWRANAEELTPALAAAEPKIAAAARLLDALRPAG